MDQLGKLPYRHENEPALSPEAADYAGSRSGLFPNKSTDYRAFLRGMQSIIVASSHSHSLLFLLPSCSTDIHCITCSKVLPECQSPMEQVEQRAFYTDLYAGLLADERLRRRKAGEVSTSTSPLRGSEDGVASGGPSPERVQSKLLRDSILFACPS